MVTDGPSPDVGEEAGTPRWVKAFVVLALLLVLLAAAVMLTGGHGPGVHVP